MRNENAYYICTFDTIDEGQYSTNAYLYEDPDNETYYVTMDHFVWDLDEELDSYTWMICGDRDEFTYSTLEEAKSKVKGDQRFSHDKFVAEIKKRLIFYSPSQFFKNYERQDRINTLFVMLYEIRRMQV